MNDKHEWLVELPDGETTTTQYITDEELKDYVFQISPSMEYLEYLKLLEEVRLQIQDAKDNLT